MSTPTSILITGASSGIGAALARAYAAPGVRLFLSARNKSRLAAVAQECQHLGSQVELMEIDVTERMALRQWMEGCDRQWPLDLVIANAGIFNRKGKHDEEYEREIFAVNLLGVLNTIYPAIDLMRARQRGQIVIMSSLAALHGLARAPAYSASKAAIKTLGDALRNRLRKDNIKVSVVCPGFVKTPLTEKNSYPIPFILTPERAVQVIMRGLQRDRGLILFPWTLYSALWLAKLLPRRLTQRILRRKIKRLNRSNK